MNKIIYVKSKETLNKSMWFIIDAIGIKVQEHDLIPEGKIIVYDKAQAQKNFEITMNFDELPNFGDPTWSYR